MFDELPTVVQIVEQSREAVKTARFGLAQSKKLHKESRALIDGSRRLLAASRSWLRSSRKG